VFFLKRQPACGDRLPAVNSFIEVLLLTLSFFVHFLLVQRACYFLCLDTKKVTKEPSPQGYFFTLGPLKQYCLLKALAASFKTVGLPCSQAPSLKLPTGQFLNARPSKFSEADLNPFYIINIFIFF
jgi:hypothetical protein